MGRRPLDKARITVKLSRDIKAALDKLALRKGMDRSSLIERLLRRGMGRG